MNLDATQARLFLLVRAHETGEAGAAWSAADRAWASDEALRRAGPKASAEAWLAMRSSLAAGRLAERQPALATLLDARGPGRGSALLLVGVALLAGLSTHLIGLDQRMSLLAPALLGLLTWNLAVYAVLAWRGLRPARASTPRGLRHALVVAAERWGRRMPSPLTPATQRFLADWLALSAPLQGARVAAALHLAAAAFAAGAVLGLYGRGLGVAFRAGWESTFLDAAQVHALLGLVLGPAAWLSGQGLPDLAQVEALQVGRGPGGDAAPWIHWYAITVGAVVLLPRGLLAACAAWRAARLQRQFPLDVGEPYVQALWRQWARHQRQPGGAVQVQVQPVQYQLGPERLPALHAALADDWGPGLALELLATIDTEAPIPARPALPLFAMTATPEADTHGRLLRRWPGVRPPGAEGLPPLVLVDESGFRKRLAAADLATRLAQRRAAWEALLAEHGHRPLFIDLDALGGGR